MRNRASFPTVTDVDGPSALRRLPAVGRWLDSPELAAHIDRHGRKLVTDAARRAIEAARSSVLAGEAPPDASALLDSLERELRRAAAPVPRRVLNGTGVVLHTNLGRAPLAAAAREALEVVAHGYHDVELDLSTGRRGQRDRDVGALAAELCGAEAGTVVNNCAGATLLMLAALARGGEVLVSRGELVEIGGGFRVPDIMAESGATLVEVGTTNKTYARDYSARIGPQTRAILSVHRSNFAIVGFEHSPTRSELAKVAREASTALLVDLGSGRMAPPSVLGDAAEVAHEPSPADWIEAGADIVAFSGDKLLGGPQAGLLVGSREAIERCRRHPLARALRLDKLGLAALGATLHLYRAGRAGEIPTLAAFAEPAASVRARAERLAASLGGAGNPEVVSSVCTPGGGALPLVELPSFAVVLGPRGGEAERLSARLRAGEPAILGRFIHERVALDLRTLDDDEIPATTHGILRALDDRVDLETTGASG